jgi:hypothetical protein
MAKRSRQQMLWLEGGMPDREYLRIPDAAMLASCSEAKIKKMLEARELTTFKLGRCTLVSVRELLGSIKAA